MLNRTTRLAACFLSLLFVSGFASAGAQNPKALFYLTRSPASVRSFLAHAEQIDILVPTWYSVDQDGLVAGGTNPLVLATPSGFIFQSCPSLAMTASIRRSSTSFSRIQLPSAR